MNKSNRKSPHGYFSSSKSAVGEYVPRRVVETRRTLRIWLDVDAPDADYKQVIIPGDNECPPLTALDMLQSDVHAAIEAAIGDTLDLGLLATSVRLGEVHEYKAESVAW